MAIKYLIGDATDPKEVPGPKLLIHVCNDQCAWGAGFVLALSKRWEAPEKTYRAADPGKGQIQMIQVEPDLYVINMVAQTLGWTQGKDGKMIPPIDYDALDECLYKVKIIAEALGASIVAPRFGAGLAGGKWSWIEEMIEEIFSPYTKIYIYDLPEK